MNIEISRSFSLSSNDHNQDGHGIESPDMAWEENCLTNSTACNGTCIEKLVS
jgi:hypothetical protein